jgi:hypothetical protein
MNEKLGPREATMINLVRVLLRQVKWNRDLTSLSHCAKWGIICIKMATCQESFRIK